MRKGTLQLPFQDGVDQYFASGEAILHCRFKDVHGFHAVAVRKSLFFYTALHIAPTSGIRDGLNDCKIKADAETLIAVLSGKLKAEDAVSDGKLQVEGDGGKALTLINARKAPAKKPVVKKAPAKKTATKKTPVKKTATKK